MQPRGIDHHAEFLQIMRVTELMQRERLIDRRGLAHDIDRAVDGLLRQSSARKTGLAAIRSASVITNDESSGRGTT